MLQKLHETLLQSNLLYPEISLAILAIFLVLLAAFSVSYRVCLTVFVIGICVEMLLNGFANNFNGNFNNWENDLIAKNTLQTTIVLLIQSNANILIFKYLFAISGILTALLSVKETKLKKDGIFLALLTTVILGMNLAISTNNLLLLFLAIETVSICSYLLIIFNKTYKSSEAAVKYFLVGATTSGVMLYGISLLYGFAASLTISEIASKALEVPSLPFYFACVLTITGLLFKIVAVPLHIWVGDVYEGTATSLVAFLTTASKFLGIAILFNILQVTGFYKLSTQNFIAFLAIISLLFGTFGAIWQQNTKRLLAYSSVAHSGFLLALLSIANTSYTSFTTNFATLIFYLVSYLLLSYAAFYSILLVENERKSTDIQAFAGIGKTQNWFGILLFVIFIGFAALPPTSGFTAKLLVFTTLINSYTANNQVITLVLLLVMLLTSLLSLYIYLKIPYYIFFREAQNEEIANKEITTTLFDKIMLALLCLGIIVLFFKPTIF